MVQLTELLLLLLWCYLKQHVTWVMRPIHYCLLWWLSRLKMEPSSCDTFVALPPSTEGRRVIFAKNSDRPGDEVQEVLYFPARHYSAGEKVEVGAMNVLLLPHNVQFTILTFNLCHFVLLVLWKVYVHWDRAGWTHLRSGAEQTSVALGSRDGCKWASSVYWEWGGVGQRKCRWRGGASGHGSCEVRPLWRQYPVSFKTIPVLPQRRER